MSTTLLRGGTVYSPADPFATAMVVDGRTIAWVGSDGAAEAHRDAVDTVVELDGALVTPAFVDAHVHTTATGLALEGLDLTGTPSLALALERLARHVRDRQHGGVVLGHGWDETGWPEGRPPSREEVDRAAAGAPVYLSRIDAHSAVVSSALLAAVPEAAGLTGFDPGGPVSRDAHHALRRAALAALTPAGRRAAQRAARRRAAELGIGCLHEMAGPDISGADDLRDLLELAAAEPGPEVIGYWGELGGPGLEGVSRARALGAHGAGGDLCVDGALGSHTACLSHPYADAGTSGVRYLDEHQVAGHLVACTEAGVQAGFHVIGDEAVRTALAGFALAGEKIGAHRLAAARHRLEHVEMISPELVPVLARHGIVAGVQPAFDALWGGSTGLYATRLGAERAAGMNPFAALVGAGVVLAFGSDAPVTPLDPWGAIRAAACHHSRTQRLTVRAAFAAHTRGGWRAVGADEAGVLVPGTPATYAVWRTGSLVVQTPDSRVAAWSTDPRAGVPGLPEVAPDVELPTCLRTVVRGAAVFDREGALR